MPTVPPRRVPRRRTPAAAVVLSIAVCLGAALPGCEYEYSADHWDDDSPSIAASPPPDAALPQDPHLNEPVTGDELNDWVDRVLPDAEGHVFQTSYGSRQSRRGSHGDDHAASRRHLFPDVGVQEHGPGLLHGPQWAGVAGGPEFALRDVTGQRRLPVQGRNSHDPGGRTGAGQLRLPGEADLRHSAVPGSPGAPPGASQVQDLLPRGLSQFSPSLPALVRRRSPRGIAGFQGSRRTRHSRA